jgi:hypothetical protein
MDCLPFDILIKIAKYFNLRDSYSFSKSFVRAHDAVYYVYSHRKVLDFESVLTVDDKVIGISDEEILQLLHAHTRAVYITNFALPPSFSMFPDLETYMRTYLCPAFEGAHARGQLCQIQFSRLWGARGSSSEDTALLYYSVENQFDDHGILTVCGEFVGGPPKQTWSTVDLDAPWEDPYQYFIPPEDDLAEEAMEAQ